MVSLDTTDRGTLEKIIEHGIEKIPTLLQSFRTQETKARFQIINPEEFCYGHIHGRIFAEFAAHYVITHGKNMSDDEVTEVGEVLERRSKDIKIAIFNCG